MTTPAPSLEDLPPERGTILELHSIGHEDFDGKLVEFHGIAKATGKYIVVSCDEKEQRMAVKPRVCKRPDIKPLELRQLLYHLVIELNRSGRQEGIEERIQQLLQKDPCSVPLHFLQTAVPVLWNNGSGSQELQGEVVLKHLYRAHANLYAYSDILLQDDIFRIKAAFLTALGNTGRYNEAIKLRPRSANTGDAPLQIREEYFLAKTYMAEILRCDKRNHTNKKIKAYLQFADHLFKFFRCAIDDDDDTHEGLTEELVSNVDKIATFFVNLRHDTCQRLSAEGVLIGNKEAECRLQVLQVQKYILHVCTRALEACTMKNGKIGILTKRTVKLLSKSAEEARHYIVSVEGASARVGDNRLETV